MKAGAQTHRDTLAFVLAIVGAMAWSTFPIGGLLFGDGNRVPTAGTLAIAIVGALIGAWSGASVWRHVSPITAAVAGSISMAALIGVMALVEHDRIHAGVIEIVMMVVVALAAGGGGVLGRRAEIPRVALTAAWITVGIIAIAGAAMAALEISGVMRTDEVIVPVVFLVPFPGALVAAIFCHVRPGALAGRLFLLTVAAFALLSVTSTGFDGETLGILLGVSLVCGGVLAGYGALAAWLGHAIRRRLRYEPPLPSAQVVDR